MRLDKILAKGVNNLYRHPTSGIIYYRRHHKGSEITRSTRSKKIEEAKRFVESLSADEQKPKTEAATFAIDHFERWIESKRTLGARAGTITSLNSSLKHLRPYLETMFVGEIDADWWTSVYIPDVRRKTHADRRFFNDWKWLNGFLKNSHESGKIAKLPKLKNPDKKTSVGRTLSDDEVGDLLNFAQNPDLHLAILMATSMGMRRNEIFALRCSAIDPKKKTISLTEDDTKTKKARKFMASPIVWPYLVKRLQSGSPWVFPSKADPNKSLHKDGYKTAWTNLKKICGIRCRFHDLRHTFLTKAFKAPGANPALICHYAGLSLEVAERVYLHFDEDDTKAVAGLVQHEAFGENSGRPARGRV